MSGWIASLSIVLNRNESIHVCLGVWMAECVGMAEYVCVDGCVCLCVSVDSSGVINC